MFESPRNYLKSTSSIDELQPEDNVRSKNKLKVTISSDHLRNIKRSFVLAINLISFSGCVIAAIQVFHGNVGFLEVGLFLLMYFLTGIGITVGYHRYFTHKAFETSSWLSIILAILGSMAAHAPIISWVATHRCHHQYSDIPEDPHSPHLHGEEGYGKTKGLWYAHMGWLLGSNLPNSILFAKDLLKNPTISKINQLYLLWVFLGLVIPALLGGLISWSWVGMFQGFLWGGLVRVFLSFHATCTVNSIAHVFGNRPFKTSDQSRNNIWVAIPTVGEGWHNNHHAFPNSAILGLEWWQIDPGAWTIRCLEKLHLVWNVKSPSKEMIAAKRVIKI